MKTIELYFFNWRQTRRRNFFFKIKFIACPKHSFLSTQSNNLKTSCFKSINFLKDQFHVFCCKLYFPNRLKRLKFVKAFVWKKLQLFPFSNILEIVCSWTKLLNFENFNFLKFFFHDFFFIFILFDQTLLLRKTELLFILDSLNKWPFRY